MGVIAGMGFAFASMPALALIGRYFNKKRSLANGISRSGGGAFFFLSPLLIYSEKLFRITNDKKFYFC